MSTPDKNNFDFIIIGSGFGGSVCAMRLAQKKYKVAVLEMGRRYRDQDFPKSNWNVFSFLWFPILKCFGIQKITFINRLLVLHGVGVGGGSLVYANTLMQPDDVIFKGEDQWPKSVDWASELRAHYQMAKKMLGVVQNPHLGSAEHELKRLAADFKVSETFHPTDVGVYFGNPGVTVDDPFFEGEGPRRTGCALCGGCMIGCRHGAKNTLEKNYLYFAEKSGAQIIAKTQVTQIIPVKNGQSEYRYRIQTRVSTRYFKKGPEFKTKNVIVASGVLGTLKLLFKNKYEFKTLTELSDQLGKDVRTNGESLVSVTSLKPHSDYSQGIAIGAAFHPNPNTKIEAVKYPSGSGFMGLLAVPLTPNGSRSMRILKMSLKLGEWIRSKFVKDWAKNSIVLLVMQSMEQKTNLIWNRRLNALKNVFQTRPLDSFIPLANEAATKLASNIGGVGHNVFSEVLFSAPATAHILGGCKMGDSAITGVVDTNHEVFNYPGLYVCDGSLISSNLGVNPSLTITALAERFSAQFAVNSSKDSSDHRG